MAEETKELSPLSLLQAQVTQTVDQLSILEKLLKGLNNFFSKEDLDQKTIITETNAIGMVEIETSNEYLKKYLGEKFYDRVAQSVVDRRRVNNKSVEGKGVDLMIEFVDAFSGKQETKVSETTPDKIRRMA